MPVGPRLSKKGRAYAARRSPSIRTGFGAAVLLLVLGGCGSSPRPEAATFACNPIQGQQLPDGYTAYFDSVALPTAPGRKQALQTNRRDSEDGSVEYFSKAPIFFRGTKAVSVEVVNSASSLLNWEARAGRVVTPKGCDSGDREWSHIVGGFIVSRPACLSLKVARGSSSTVVQVGVGTPCSGQAAPSQPSDT